MLDALLQKRFFTGGKRVLVNLLRGLLYLLHRVHAGAEVRNFELRQAVLALGAQGGWQGGSCRQDYGGNDRVILLQRPGPAGAEQSQKPDEDPRDDNKKL